MKVLVVGSGGREHALAWKLVAEPGVGRAERIDVRGRDEPVDVHVLTRRP